MTEPYSELGGLKRPGPYWGAIEFDCPDCGAFGSTLETDGEKCRYEINPGEWRTRKTPCVGRIKRAKQAGYL